MERFYTNERNAQMLLYLMKAHGIKKVIVSPGATNVCLVGSLQADSYFELYSCVDERSAAYMACGMAAESGEPVALSCTGATASRNYLPGLTEAYYRRLPVLAMTSTQHPGRIGHNIPQVIDRTSLPKDTVKMSVLIPNIHDDEDEWAYGAALNKALLELRRAGGGPVHVNLATGYSQDFSVKELPATRVIRRIGHTEECPALPEGRIGIFAGAHRRWSEALTQSVNAFCKRYGAAVICDHTSNYTGPYKASACLAANQEQYRSPVCRMELLIHIGDISGAYMNLSPSQVWRVHPDGEIRDTFRALRYTFEMEEETFFRRYAEQSFREPEPASYFGEWGRELGRLREKIPELPFSNVWIAQQTLALLPENSALYLGILHSLRSWNFFEKPDSVEAYANTGGFGIDGGISSLAGAALASPAKLFFGVTGDLAFFYDMNALGNRHLGSNIRILLVNNGRGTEFRNYSHPAARFGEGADAFMAAAGHFGSQSRELARHYAQDLGFEYMAASGKEEYLDVRERFLTPARTERPMLLEVFTDSREESRALEMISNLETSAAGRAKKLARKALGEDGVRLVKGIIKKK